MERFHAVTGDGAEAGVLIDTPGQGPPNARVGFQNQHTPKTGPCLRDSGRGAATIFDERVDGRVSPHQRVRAPLEADDQFARISPVYRLPTLVNRFQINAVRLCGRHAGVLRAEGKEPTGTGVFDLRGQIVVRRLAGGGKAIVAAQQTILPVARVGFGKAGFASSPCRVTPQRSLPTFRDEGVINGLGLRCGGGFRFCGQEEGVAPALVLNLDRPTLAPAVPAATGGSVFENAPAPMADGLVSGLAARRFKIRKIGVRTPPGDRAHGRPTGRGALLRRTRRAVSVEQGLHGHRSGPNPQLPAPPICMATIKQARASCSYAASVKSYCQNGARMRLRT